MTSEVTTFARPGLDRALHGDAGPSGDPHRPRRKGVASRAWTRKFFLHDVDRPVSEGRGGRRSGTVGRRSPTLRRVRRVDAVRLEPAGLDAGRRNRFPVHRGRRAFREARAAGLRLLVADPRRSETALESDIRLALRLGTETLLVAAMPRAPRDGAGRLTRKELIELGHLPRGRTLDPVTARLIAHPGQEVLRFNVDLLRSLLRHGWTRGFAIDRALPHLTLPDRLSEPIASPGCRRRSKTGQFRRSLCGSHRKDWWRG